MKSLKEKAKELKEQGIKVKIKGKKIYAQDQRGTKAIIEKNIE